MTVGVLRRDESLAANLGAKLVGPLLLKSFEKLFDGPIKVIHPSYGLEQSPITWLDIVTYARTNASEFILTDANPGFPKTCRFWIKGGQIEISEDDYRLIVSGAPERMIPTQPIAEDESAELGTLNILETRLAMLIKKADSVAGKARQLNYHLKGRKSAIMGRKAAEQPAPVENTNNFSPQPFSAVNARSSQTPNGEISKIQQSLLEQFMAKDRRSSVTPSRPKARSSNAAELGNTTFNDEDDHRMSNPRTSTEDDTEGQYRLKMASKIEKLARGKLIYPPCDRCRRLKFECTKHLTACQACTKKHAKCSWKDIQKGELDYVPSLPPDPNQPPPKERRGASAENGYSVTGGEGMSPASGGGGGTSGGAGGFEASGGMERQRQGQSPMEALMDVGNLSEHAMLTQIASAAAAASSR